MSKHHPRPPAASGAGAPSAANGVRHRPCRHTRRHWWLSLLSGLTVVAVTLPGAHQQAAAAQPGAMLFDFETDDAITRWHDEGRTTLGGNKTLTRVQRLATAGRCAMEFRTPAWKHGLAEWPAFECRPPITDWTGYDRLVFDVTNESL